MLPLVLASSSPWRRALLEAAGLPVVCEAPGVDERAFQAPTAEALAGALALAKASAVRERNPMAIVIGADQVAWSDDDPTEAWGKPRDRVDQVERLHSLVGRAHHVTTGLAVLGPSFRDEVVVRTTLWMRSDVTKAEIEAYAATGEGEGCAGGYAVEQRGAFLFDRVEGDWNNVIGLPVARLFDVLRARGWRFA